MAAPTGLRPRPRPAPQVDTPGPLPWTQAPGPAQRRLSLADSTYRLVSEGQSFSILSKTKEEEILPNSMYEASITQLQRPDEDTVRKDHKPVSLMNLDVKFSIKYQQSKVSSTLEGFCVMIK